MPVSLDDVQKSISALVKQNKINSLIYSLVVPLIIGVYATFYSDLVKINVLLFWIPVLFFVVFAVITAYFTYDVKLAPEIYVEADNAQSQILYLESTTRFLSILQEQALALGAMVREHVKKHEDGENHLREAIVEICSLVAENRSGLFDFDSNELWSMSAYIFCENENVLRAVWRMKHEKHPSKTIGRDWKPGQGHVGIAWSQAEGKICPDVSAPGIFEMFSPTEVKQDYDRIVYASFVSEPIGPLGESKQPYGVLVATSSLAGRFNIASALPLRHAASAIAALIYLTYDQSALAELVDTVKPSASDDAI